jgi:hypothetical protein
MGRPVTMRTLLVALLVLVSGLSLSGAQAGGEAFLVDAEGDTEINAVFSGSPAKAPFRGGDSDNADLLSFDIQEADTALDLVFTVKTLKQTASDATYYAYFTWGKVEYVVAAQQRTIPNVNTYTGAYLYTRGAFSQSMGDLPYEVDAEKGTFRVTIQKAYLLDQDEETPTKGDVLKDVSVEAVVSLAAFRIGLAGEVSDRLPDDGTKDFTLQVGDLMSGHLMAEAENRIRVSNGGSTTFVYRVALSNTGEGSDEVEVSTGVLPEGWNTTVQSPVRLGPDETKVLTVLASVPFGHTHGGFDSFNVTMQSRFDPGSRAVVRLGVLHTPVPQPAGHHDELFLHAKQQGGLLSWGGDVSMNTDAAHDADAAEAPSYSRDGDAMYWWIPLNPSLAMGMDFDLERLGALAGSVIGRTTGEATVRAELLYGSAGQAYDEGETILLAESDDQTVTLDLRNPTPFSLVMTPLEESDYISFNPSASLYLRVELAGSAGTGFLCCVPETSPSLLTADFKLKLPLNEYHDKLTGVAEAAAAIDVIADGPVEKLGRPGTTMTYGFTLRNGGSTPVVLDVDLAGSGVDLGTVVPAGPVSLEPGESRKVTLAVGIPSEAKEGEEIEVLLFAHAQDDPSKTAIARTKTTVTLSGEAAADETDVLLAAQSADNDTPGLGAFGTLAALGVALLAFRRR